MSNTNVLDVYWIHIYSAILCIYTGLIARTHWLLSNARFADARFELQEVILKSHAIAMQVCTVETRANRNAAERPM